VTINELKALRRGDRVVYASGSYPAVEGAVNAIDERSVELFWYDGTSSLLWFAHCEDGRDPRHEHLTRIGGK
jgi:hypothetical protein